MADDQRSLWVEDRYATRCFRCKKEFGLIRRRHHCRQCGQVFCSGCLNNVPTASPTVASSGSLMNSVFGVQRMDKICEACEKQRKQSRPNVPVRAAAAASGNPTAVFAGTLHVSVDELGQSTRSDDDTPKHAAVGISRTSNLSPVGSPISKKQPTYISVPELDLSNGSFTISALSPQMSAISLPNRTASPLNDLSRPHADGWRHPETAKDLTISSGMSEVPITVENSVAKFIASLVDDARKNPVQPRQVPVPRRPRQYHAFPRASFRTGEKCAEAGLFATSFLDTGNHQARTGILDVLESNCSRHLMKRVRMLLDEINAHGLPVASRSAGIGHSHRDAEAMYYDPLGATQSDLDPRLKFCCSPKELTSPMSPDLPSLSPRSTHGPTFVTRLPPIDTRLWANVICDIAWKTVSQTIAEGDAQIMSHVDIISCLGGGDIADIDCVPGIVIIQNIASKKMASRIDRPRILLLGGDVGTITNLASDFYEYTQTYPGSLEKYYQRLLMWKPTLILVEKSMHHFLQSKISSNPNMTLVTSVPRFLLERIARNCGGRIIDDLGMVSMAELTDPRLSPLGSCNSFQLVDINNRPVLMLSGLPQQTFTTIILRGAEVDTLAAIRYVLYVATATAYHLALQTHYLVDFNGILAQMSESVYSPRKVVADDDDDAMPCLRSQVELPADSPSETPSADSLPRVDDQSDMCAEFLTMNMGVQFPESVLSVSRTESLLLRDNIVVNAIFLDAQSTASSRQQQQAQTKDPLGSNADSQQGDDSSLAVSSMPTSEIRKQRQVYDYYQAGDKTLLDFLLKRISEASNSTRIIVHGKKQLIVRTLVEVRDLFEATNATSPWAGSAGAGSTRPSEQSDLSIAAVRVSESLSNLFLVTMRGSFACSSMQSVPMCYTTCKECLRNPNNARSASTTPFPVSPHTLSLSFGSFLELSIYASENCISSCGHRLHDDFIRKFVLYPTDGTQVTISFEVEKLKLGEIVGPPRGMSDLTEPPEPSLSESPASSTPATGGFSYSSPSQFLEGSGWPARSSEELYFADELAEIKACIAELGVAFRLRQSLPVNVIAGGREITNPTTAASPATSQVREFAGEGGVFRESREDNLLLALSEIRTTKGLKKFRQSLLNPAVDDFAASLNSILQPDRRASLKKQIDMQKIRPSFWGTNEKFCLRLNEPTNIISAVLTEMQEQEQIVVTEVPAHGRTMSLSVEDSAFQRMMAQAIRSVTNQMMPQQPAAPIAPPPPNIVGDLARTPPPSNGGTPLPIVTPPEDAFESTTEMFPTEPPEQIPDEHHEQHSPLVLDDQRERQSHSSDALDEVALHTSADQPQDTLTSAPPVHDPPELPELNETIEHIAGNEGVSNAFVRDNFNAEDEAIEVLLGKAAKTSQTTFKYVFRDLVCSEDGMKQNVTVEVLFPHQFAALRFLYGKSSGGIDELLLSLSRCTRFKTDGGKTKSDFFVTMDKRYMLKQIKHRELKHFFAFGPSYFQHMARFFSSGIGRSSSPSGGAEKSQSVLVKIFGIFSIQHKKRRTALGGDIKYYMLMENLLYNRHVDLMYDLKGSQRNRTAAEGSSVMLDQDLVRETKRGHFFFCSEEDRSWITDTLASDASLLASCDIMDYSLIVGVEHHTRRQSLVVGIIDFLHPYTGTKIIESNVKKGLDVMFGPAGGRDPTIIEPAQYRERFLRWMNAYFCDVPDKISQIRRLASAQQKKQTKYGERPSQF